MIQRYSTIQCFVNFLGYTTIAGQEYLEAVTFWLGGGDCPLQAQWQHTKTLHLGE